MTGQVGGSIVVWDDGNAGKLRSPSVGLPGNPAVRYSSGECRLRMGWAQANEIPWSNRAQKSPVSL